MEKLITDGQLELAVDWTERRNCCMKMVLQVRRGVCPDYMKFCNNCGVKPSAGVDTSAIEELKKKILGL
jgi:hypothetical protein